MAPDFRPPDRTDRRILDLLQKEARLSNKELASRVGLAPSSCHARVQRLVESGAIRGFHAYVEPEVLGVGLQVLLALQLERHGQSAIELFRDHLLEFEEVVELYSMGGSLDLLVRVAVRDTDHLRRFVIDHISARPEVRRLETSILFEHRRSLVWPDYSE